MSDKTFYISTPIYYPSDKLHIGHAYTTVAADALARFRRMQGYDVLFLTGTDEHGQKIQRRAEEEGVTPKEYVDEIVAWIRKLWQELEITNDDFVRTTEKRHHEVVQNLFMKIYENGDIYKDKYRGLYCTPCEMFWLERQVDEDENCPDCGRPTEWVEEESYFFEMSRYADRLLEHIEQNPEFIQPVSRRNEMINFIEDGLEDLCISRTTFDWGIPVPIDDDHVIYVWFDALSNYLTGCGYESDPEKYSRFWPADIHLVGKEIVRFHSIIWPIMLMAAGVELPKKVYGHGWLILEEGKMSKSRGNVVDPLELKEEFGLDPIRYYLLREISFGSDGNYSQEALINRINADLANDLGNLLHRTVAMVDQYVSGRIPRTGREEEVDGSLKAMHTRTVEQIELHMDRLELSEALKKIWALISRTNKYIDETEPWILGREEKKERLGTVLYNLCESLARIGVMISPFITETPKKIWNQLGLQGDIDDVQWAVLDSWGIVTPGETVNPGDPIFPRLDPEDYLGDGDDEKVEESEPEKQEESASKKEEEDTGGDQKMEGVEMIEFADFKKLDLRVAQILKAERVPDTDRLLRLEVETGGGEERQLVAGIAENYSPEDVVGKKIVIVANLEPATIRGVRSEGMLLAASRDDELSLLTVDRDIPTGSVVQ